MEINGLEKKEGFPKKYRLTGDKEISEIVRNGRTVGAKYFCLKYLPAEHKKIAVRVGRKVGRPVVRNKIRRWVREIFRKNKEKFPDAHIVVLVNENAICATFWDFHEEFLKALQKIKNEMAKV